MTYFQSQYIGVTTDSGHLILTGNELVGTIAIELSKNLQDIKKSSVTPEIDRVFTSETK